MVVKKVTVSLGCKGPYCFLHLLRLLTHCTCEQEWRWVMLPCRTRYWPTGWRTPFTATTWESQVWICVLFPTKQPEVCVSCWHRDNMYCFCFLSGERGQAVGRQPRGAGPVRCPVPEQSRGCTESRTFWSGDCPRHGAVQKRFIYICLYL